MNENEILARALLLACKRIADSSQTYEEANSAEAWKNEFVRRAESEADQSVTSTSMVPTHV